MFSEPQAKFKNETKIKTSLRARGPPGVSGALRRVRILRIGRIGSDQDTSLSTCWKCTNVINTQLSSKHKTEKAKFCPYMTYVQMTAPYLGQALPLHAVPGLGTTPKCPTPGGHQTRSWRASVLESLAPTLIKHTWTS